MEKACDAGAGFAGIAHAPFNKAMLYLNRANNARRFSPTGARVDRHRSPARYTASVFV
ncbi:hypothetical protein [Burkholderia ambifaria]|uniref:hypothetical protein n=1 Tax=Burkholderia ambifaria TaxID=152480 RepID=UPI001F4A07B3|nr:hypothetical protein [Burkholderia ambifaria]